MRRLVPIILLLLLSGCTTAPSLSNSTGISATVATLATEQNGVFYLLTIDLDNDIPENTYAVIQYQNLHNPKQTNAVDLGSLGNAKRINFKSLPSPAIDTAKPYLISLILYQDSELKQVTASWYRQLEIELPANIAHLLNIKLL